MRRGQAVLPLLLRWVLTQQRQACKRRQGGNSPLVVGVGARQVQAAGGGTGLHRRHQGEAACALWRHSILCCWRQGLQLCGWQEPTRF